MKRSTYTLQIKLVLSLIMFTLLMTAIVTSLEMNTQYREGIKELHRSFQRISDEHNSTFAENLWQFDERSIEIQMKSIVSEGAVISVQLIDSLKGIRQFGDTTTTGALITASYPIIKADSKENLGTMKFFGTDATLRNELIHQIPRIIFSELTKIVTASIFLLVLFYILFGRHLNRIIAYADTLSLQNLESKLTLKRHGNSSNHDELERLTMAINHMTDRIMEDVTERRRAEQLIAAKNKELEQIVYVTSHDLRSPLVNVDGYSRELEFSIEDLEAVLMDSSSDQEISEKMRVTLPELKNALQFIRGSTRQMDKVLKGLLTLSRSGRAALTIEKINMNDLAKKVLASFDYQFKELGVLISIASLPECIGDEVQITQIISNLVSNSLKYRNPSRQLSITIRGERSDSRCEYCIADNGIGIAVEHQEKIFELFHRLNPKASDGEGLGLTIVRQSLWRMDGEIRVVSKVNEGTQFYLSLPVNDGTI